MLKKIISFLLIVVLLFAFGCSSTNTQGSTKSTSPGSAKEPILIGAVYPLTGSIAAIGQNCKNGIDMAVKDYNDKGGINGRPIEIVWGDSQGDPKIGMSEAERLITTKNIVCLLGCYNSAVTEVVAQVAEKYKIAHLTAISSSSALTAHGYKYFFRLGLPNYNNARDIVAFAREFSDKYNKNFKTCAIFTDNSILGQELVKYVRVYAKQYNFEILAEAINNSNTTDLSAEILKLKEANPDVIFADHYVSDAILATKTMKELNFKPPIFVSKATGYIDPSYIKSVGADCEGMVTMAEFAPDSPRGVEINKRFHDLYGNDMNGHACMTYTAICLLKNIIEMTLKETGSLTRDAIKDQLTKCKIENAQFPDGTKFIVPYDTIEFSDAVIDGVQHTNANMPAKPTIMQIQNGKYCMVWPFKSANTEIIYPATYSKP